MTKELKVLFIQASSLSGTLHGERLEHWTKEDDYNVFNTPIKVDFINTQNNTVSNVAKHALTEGYDAIVIEESPTFKSDQTGFAARDLAYKELGLDFVQGPWAEFDPNYPYSDVALAGYLKKCFKAADIAVPKMATINIHANISHAQEREIHLITNNKLSGRTIDFHISTGYEGPDDHVKSIYEACDIT